MSEYSALLMKGHDNFSLPFITHETQGAKGSGMVSFAKSENEIKNMRQEKTL
jgi:hypothetical protein